MIIMKKAFAVLLTFILLFSLAACGGKGEEGLTEIVLCLDWTPNTNHTGFYAADSLGYYEQEGIKIKIVQPPEDGAEIMTASGQAQFGISFQDLLGSAFALDEPLEITAVAAVLQHNTSGIISRKGEGMDTPSGLENKRYSTWNSPIELKMVEHLMKKSGADYEKLELVPSVTNEAEALRNGDADAIWIYYGWAGIACELADLEFDYFNMTDMEETFDYYTPVIVANNTFLEENPEKAKAFLRATEKGYRYAAENPEEAAQLLIKGDTTGSLAGSEELVTESQKWMASQYIADSERWGYIDGDRWNAFYEWLYAEGLVDRDISGKGFTNNYLG
ncbi:MAG: ABC transporter substrate-binding protein [Clostridia bacterium]|nr:ABC transporter substrate-binding protein [Clostridia bacterium]